MVNRIGSLLITAAETKYDVATDIGGFDMAIIQPEISCQVSVNGNANYLTYNAGQKYPLPGPVNDLYIKGGSGVEKLQYWFFD